MTFLEFAAANHARCVSPEGFDHKLEHWSTSDWMVAMIGEVGEACNIVKKMNRLYDGIKQPGGESLEELAGALQDELADTFIYLDLITQSLGWSLEQLVIEKFNATSDRIGYPKVTLR